MVAYGISFTYWSGGQHHNELNLLQNGLVVFQSIDDRGGMVPRGTPHGSWYLDVEEQIVVHFDHYAGGAYIKKHVFTKINDMTNAYQLATRDDETIPNKYHPQRAVLLQNSR